MLRRPHKFKLIALIALLLPALKFTAHSAETREQDPSLPDVFTNVQQVLDLGPTLSRRFKREARPSPFACRSSRACSGDSGEHRILWE